MTERARGGGKVLLGVVFLVLAGIVAMHGFAAHGLATHGLVGHGSVVGAASPHRPGCHPGSAAGRDVDRHQDDGTGSERVVTGASTAMQVMAGAEGSCGPESMCVSRVPTRSAVASRQVHAPLPAWVLPWHPRVGLAGWVALGAWSRAAAPPGMSVLLQVGVSRT